LTGKSRLMPLKKVSEAEEEKEMGILNTGKGGIG